MSLPDFATLAAEPEPALDELALAMASEFRPVDADAALGQIDALGEELAKAQLGTPREQVEACRELLSVRHGFAGDRDDYDHPDNSMLDLVLERRRGLPILLSLLYVEVARRAGVALAGVGLPGHYVVGHFGAEPPLLLDPFSPGAPVGTEVPADLVRPWGAHETALRMLNNLVSAYSRRSDLAGALKAAKLRLALPAEEDVRTGLAAELRSLQARLN